MSQKENLAFPLGGTWIIDLACVNEAGEALDLGDAADVQFRLVQDGDEVAVDLTLTSGVAVVDADAGLARVSVQPANQAGVAVGRHAYETRVLMDDGSIHEQQYGALVVRSSLFASIGHAPTMIFMAPNLVAALGGPGAWIGDLVALDPDGDEDFTWDLVDDLDGRFAIDGSALVIGAAGIGLADVGTTLLPRVRVTDGDDNQVEARLSVVVLPAATLSYDLAGQVGLMNALGML